MEHPIVMKVVPRPPVTVHQVNMEPMNIRERAGPKAPAIVCVRSATILSDKGVGLIDANDVIASTDGDWSQTLLVVLPEAVTEAEKPIVGGDGDAAFLDEVAEDAPALLELAKHTVAAIRSSGVQGRLQKSKLGRWVNQPVNAFTVKAQPRAGNLHFTLYGEPSTYDAGDFLLKDQNSYSRGWVRNFTDVKTFAKLVREAHARRSS